MPRKPTRLTDMEYDEVSLVGIPANQHADIVLFKSYTKPEEGPTLIRRSRTGQLALARAAVALAKHSPHNTGTPQSVHAGGGSGLTRNAATGSETRRPNQGLLRNSGKATVAEGAKKTRKKVAPKKRSAKPKVNTTKINGEVYGLGDDGYPTRFGRPINPLALGRKAKPTQKHREAIWENMLGTVYARSPKGETKYFDFDWAGAAKHAGVDLQADNRVWRSDRRTSSGDTNSPRFRQQVLYVPKG